tara:strand:- start:300 stop:623 length:324 start_codon:yes stop_codon:yes gene_type:complete
MKGFDFLKQAQGMQDRLKGVQEEFSNLEVTGESGAGLVQITINGKNECTNIHIDQDVTEGSREVLEDLVASAFNNAVHKLEKAQKDKMSKMATTFGLPLDSLFSNER